MKKCFSIFLACFVSLVVVASGCKSEPAPVVETKPATEEETTGNMEAGKVPGT